VLAQRSKQARRRTLGRLPLYRVLEAWFGAGHLLVAFFRACVTTAGLGRAALVRHFSTLRLTIARTRQMFPLLQRHQKRFFSVRRATGHDAGVRMPMGLYQEGDKIDADDDDGSDGESWSTD